jgi:hypothetical protein
VFSLKCRLSRSSASAAGPGVPGPLVMTALRFWIAAESAARTRGRLAASFAFRSNFADSTGLQVGGF